MARPNLSYLKNLSLFVVGLPCGLLTGFTAIGSSVILLPLTRWLLGLRPARASGTALAATFFAALAGTLSYQQHGDIRWDLALLLVAGQLIGAAWGLRVATQFPALARLRWLWAALVIIMGLSMIYASRSVAAHIPSALVPTGWLFYAWAFGVAILVGLVSRVIELGGVLLVPAAVFLLGLPPHQAQGTALVVLLLASLPGMLIYAQRGEMDGRAATWLSLGGVIGALIGAYYAVRLPEMLLAALFGVALTLLGLGMFQRSEPVEEKQE